MSDCNVQELYGFPLYFNPLGQCFSNYGPQTTCGPSDLPLWSLKKTEEKFKFKWIVYHTHQNQCVLPKYRSFTANSGTKTTVLPKGRSSTANSGTKVVDLLDMNRCGGFPLFTTLHSLFIIWIDLKRSEEIPGAPAWRWGEWIWLTGPSGLHTEIQHMG